MSPVEGIIPGQKIDSSLLETARQLRHTMTLQEKTLWGYLRANRISVFHFRRQQIIDGYIVDFYCHKAALVIEVDGPIHLSQREYDHERDMQLKSRGLNIIHFSNDEVDFDLENVLDRIKATLEQNSKTSE